MVIMCWRFLSLQRQGFRFLKTVACFFFEMSIAPWQSQKRFTNLPSQVPAAPSLHPSSSTASLPGCPHGPRNRHQKIPRIAKDTGQVTICVLFEAL